MNNIKRVALYIRVSTDEQAINGVSLDYQKEELLKYVKDRKADYMINEKENIYIDWWYSWASDDRPAFRKMMLWARNKEFDVVFVYKIDRFFRKTLHLLDYVEKLGHYWIWFKSITQPFDTSESYWKMILGMLWVIWELEREMIRDRTAWWKLQKAKMWFFVWWWSSKYGFDIEKVEWWKKLKVNEDEKKVILKIFDLYVNENKSIWKICEYLSNKNIPTKYDTEYKDKESYDKMKPCHWHIWTVRWILNDTMYIWKYYYWKTYNKYNPETKKYEVCYREKWDPLLVEMNCEKILEDESIFYKAQELLENNKRTLNNKTTHVFTWMILCKKCGKHYIWYRSAKWTFSYRCGGAVWQKLPKEFKCYNPEVSEKFLINTIWEKISLLFSNTNRTLEDYYKNNNDNSKIIEKYKEELKEIEVELNRNNFWLTQVFSEFYMENDVSIKKIKEKVIEWYKKKIEDLNNNKNEILIKLDKYNRIESSKKWIKEVIDKFKKNIKWIGEDSKKLELIKKFVDKIIVNEDGSVKITFRFEDLWWDDKGGKKWGWNWGYGWKSGDFQEKINNLSDIPSKNLPLPKGRNEGVKSLDEQFDISMQVLTIKLFTR